MNRTKRIWLNGNILYECVGDVSVVEIVGKWRIYERVGIRVRLFGFLVLDLTSQLLNIPQNLRYS